MLKKSLLTLIVITGLIQLVNAQSDKKTPEKKPSPPITVPQVGDKSKNPEAAKFVNSGIKYRLKGEYDLAIAAFTKAIALDPNVAEAYNHRGAVYSDAQNLKSALADFNKAIELDPKQSTPYMNRAILYLIQKDYESAIADFTRLIELEPEMEVWYSFRAEAYEGAGKKELATADRQKEKALRAKPLIN